METNLVINRLENPQTDPFESIYLKLIFVFQFMMRQCSGDDLL